MEAPIGWWGFICTVDIGSVMWKWFWYGCSNNGKEPEALILCLNMTAVPDLSQGEVGARITSPTLWNSHPVFSVMCDLMGIGVINTEDTCRCSVQSGCVIYVCCYCRCVCTGTRPQMFTICATLGTDLWLVAFVPLFFKFKYPPRSVQTLVMAGAGFHSSKLVKAGS